MLKYLLLFCCFFAIGIDAKEPVLVTDIHTYCAMPSNRHTSQCVEYRRFNNVRTITASSSCDIDMLRKIRELEIENLKLKSQLQELQLYNVNN